MAYLAAALIIIAYIICGTYLIVMGYTGWAWIPFLCAACVSVQSKTKKEEA